MPAHTMGTISSVSARTVPAVAIPPGTASRTTPNMSADNNSRTAITVFASRPTMARVATIPSNATAAAATSAKPMPTRSYTPFSEPLASTAISVAPTAVTVTPSQPTRPSRWCNRNRARIAPSTG